MKPGPKPAAVEAASVAVVAEDMGVVVEAGGRRVLVFWSARALNGLDPATGAPLFREEFRIQSDLSVMTPTLHRDILFVSAFYNGALAVRLAGRPGGGVSATQLYRSAKTSEMETDIVHCLMCTPQFSGDHLYAVDSYGELRCVEAATGKRVWETLAATGKKRWSNAHLVPNGDVTFIFNESGELIIADLSPAGYREIDRAKVISPTAGVEGLRAVAWSHPAFAERSLFVRNDRELLRVDLSAH